MKKLFLALLLLPLMANGATKYFGQFFGTYSQLTNNFNWGTYTNESDADIYRYDVHLGVGPVVDQGKWAYKVGGNNLNWYAVSDDFATTQEWMRVTRSGGASVNEIRFLRPLRGDSDLHIVGDTLIDGGVRIPGTTGGTAVLALGLDSSQNVITYTVGIGGTNQYYIPTTTQVIGLGGAPNSTWLMSWSDNSYGRVLGGLNNLGSTLQMREASGTTATITLNGFNGTGTYSNLFVTNNVTVGSTMTAGSVIALGDSTFFRGANPMIQMNASSARVIGNVNANTSGANFEWRGNGLNNLLATSIDRNRVTIGMDADTYGNGLGSYFEIAQTTGISGTNTFRVNKFNNAAIGAEAFAVRSNGVSVVNFGLQVTAGSVTNGGTVWFTGTGSPEAAVAAPGGSIYTRTDGGAGTSFYVKESATGNTGWAAK